MTTGPDKEPSKQSTSEAVAWQVRLASASSTPDDRARLKEWLAESTDNARSFQRVTSFSQGMAHLNEQQRQELIALKNNRKSHSVWLNGLAIAAMAAGLVFGVWWFLGGPYWNAEYVSALGEMRTVTLTDGSIVELNTNSAIKSSWSADNRRITLLGGEAYFKVAPDANRPFEVIVGTSSVRALGTAFNIRQDNRGATISVLEHSVRITSSHREVPQDLSEGQRVHILDDGTIGLVETYDPQRSLAWRRHRLIFEHQPLDEVLTEMNRYRHGILVPVNAALHEVTVTGAFDTTRLDDALQTIESALPVKSVRLTDRLVLVYHSPSSH